MENRRSERLLMLLLINFLAAYADRWIQCAGAADAAGRVLICRNCPATAFCSPPKKKRCRCFALGVSCLNWSSTFHIMDRCGFWRIILFVLNGNCITISSLLTLLFEKKLKLEMFHFRMGTESLGGGSSRAVDHSATQFRTDDRYLHF